MKKYFFLAAMASVALASCTNDVPDASVNEQQEISFAAPVVKANSRVVDEIGTTYAETGDEANTKYDFNVWAKYNGEAGAKWSEGTFYIGASTGTGINGALVKYSSTQDGWCFSPNAYYWPKNGNLSFIAYSPASVSSKATVTNEGVQFTDYIVGSAANVDLLFSNIAYCQEVAYMDDSNDPYNGVELTFNHALSSIQFAVKTKDSYTGNTIIVKKIEVLGAYSTGDFNQTVADTYNSQMLPATKGWSNQETGENYTAYEDATGITLTDAAKYAHNGSTSPTPNKTDLILLPQTLKTVSPVHNVQVKLTYTMQNDSGGAVINQVSTFDLSTSTVSEWLRGKRYTYTIIFGLDEIYLDPSVTAWDTMSGGLSDPTL